MVQVDIQALRSIEREKEIPFEALMSALESALLTAYRHTPHSMPHARVAIDPKTGDVVVWAQEIGQDGEIEEEYDDTPTDFGRIAAMTARQVILQRLRGDEANVAGRALRLPGASTQFLQVMADDMVATNGHHPVVRTRSTSTCAPSTRTSSTTPMSTMLMPRSAQQGSYTSRRASTMVSGLWFIGGSVGR